MILHSLIGGLLTIRDSVPMDKEVPAYSNLHNVKATPLKNLDARLRDRMPTFRRTTTRVLCELGNQLEASGMFEEKWLEILVFKPPATLVPSEQCVCRSRAPAAGLINVKRRHIRVGPRIYERIYNLPRFFNVVISDE